MKRISSLLVIGLALLLACQKEVIPTTVNEVTDLYTVPADAIELPAPTAESVWATDRRYFNLSFGNVLSTSIVGFDALLPSGQYLLGDDAIGNAVKAKTKVNGQAAKDGYITVSNEGSEYAISASIDGAYYYWKGKLPFKADPAATQLTQVISAQSNLANGTKSLTMNLGTDGISQEFDSSTYQTVWKGEGGYLALDLYSDDGYLHEGSYTACATGGAIEPGQFGIGWDPGDLYGIGWVFTDWGTCWWTVKDGTATAEKITSGIVTVSREGDDWIIAWGSKYPQEVVFKGPIPALTKPEAPNPPSGGGFDYTYTIGELQVCILNDNTTVVEGVHKNPIIIVDADGNEKAYLELVLTDGTTDLEGDYVSTEYAHEHGQLANGYYMDFGEWGVFAGGSYYINEDGEKVYIDPGVTVSVTKVATGAYRFTSTGFDISAAGPDYVPDDNPGEGDGDDGSDLSGIVLKITSGLTYTLEDVTASNTSADGSALSGMTLWRVTVSDGSGTVAAFDLGTKAGSEDLAGTYTVMSYPDAVGKAGNGWGFAAWNMFGGCYYKVDGAYYFIPADATITVTALSGGALKFKFSGSIQKDDYSDGGQGGLLLNNVTKA
ncbi:MAG: hypothetical protein J5533_07660 [Bacteroidales bacterium]|nr:hypothetical protein [Bacteroidales bacterium]